ncbi:MAG: hypothetical protein QXV59_08225, partial [Nitrososphaerota archaeon]
RMLLVPKVPMSVPTKKGADIFTHFIQKVGLLISLYFRNIIKIYFKNQLRAKFKLSQLPHFSVRRTMKRIEN